MTFHEAIDGTKAPTEVVRDLCLLDVRYYSFDGMLHQGQLIVHKDVRADVEEIFRLIERLRFPVNKAVPIVLYGWSDNASMADNNTSSFNDRPVTGGSRPSLHAYGAAIDLNPVQNPFIRRSGTGLSVEPPAGLDYINRAQQRPGKPDRPGLAEAVIDVFVQNGFVVWGGYWDDPLDYQHFDIGRPLAETLAALPPEEARKRFEQSVSAARPN
jgi:hypothetical protein